MWIRSAGPVRARTASFVAVVIGLWLIAVIAADPAVAAIPALYPLIFATLPLAAALTLTFLVTLAPLALAAATHGLDWPSLPAVAAVTLVGAVAAPIIGTSIMTTMRQRQQLAETVAELAASRAEASRLSRQAGAAAERERLAREIHDTLAQGFTSIVALAQAVQAESDSDPAAAARHVELIRSTARDNLAEARTMVTRLTPGGVGGRLAVRRAAPPGRGPGRRDRHRRRRADRRRPAAAGHGHRCGAAAQRTGGDDQRAPAFPRQRGRSVRLQADADGVRLSLSDNGIGLQTDHVDGFGLRGMRARIDQVGGTLTLSRPEGGGVRVVVAVPT